jgi:protein TonB
MPGDGTDGLSLQKLLQEIDEQTVADAMRPSLAGRATLLLREHRGPAIVAGAVLLLGAAFTVARARGAGDEFTAFAEPTPGAVLPATDAAATPTSTYGAEGVLGSAAVAPVAASHAVDPTASATSTTSAPTAERTAERTATPERPSAASAPAAPKPSAIAPSVPAMSALRLDSIARMVSAAGGVTVADPMASRLTSMTARPTLGASGSAGATANTTQPARLIGAVPVARYPQSLRQSGVQGEVRVSFEVDTLGRPDMRSLVVLKSEHELFTRSVRNAIPEMRFVPAEIGGKKARWLVRMPFVFTVR